MTLSTIDIFSEWEERKTEKMTINEDNFLVSKQNNVEMKMSSCFSVSSDGMMEKQEKETIVDWRQRNKGKGTHEERKTNRMISIHREMISWCFDSLDVALNCRWSISNVIAFQYPVSEPNSMRPVKRYMFSIFLLVDSLFFFPEKVRNPFDAP